MDLRTITATTAAAVAAVAAGSALLAVPAVAGGGAATASASTVTPYTGWPAGATARVHSTSTPSGRTMVTLHVTGLEPGRTYTSHVHDFACETAGGAGGHWQLERGGDVDPVNEIWLDVTVGPDGTGHSKAVQDFAFPDTGRPRSVIIHAGPQAVAPFTPASRLACISVDF